MAPRIQSLSQISEAAAAAAVARNDGEALSGDADRHSDCLAIALNPRISSALFGLSTRSIARLFQQMQDLRSSLQSALDGFGGSKNPVWSDDHIALGKITEQMLSASVNGADVRERTFTDRLTGSSRSAARQYRAVFQRGPGEASSVKTGREAELDYFAVLSELEELVRTAEEYHANLSSVGESLPPSVYRKAERLLTENARTAFLSMKSTFDAGEEARNSTEVLQGLLSIPVGVDALRHTRTSTRFLFQPGTQPPGSSFALLPPETALPPQVTFNPYSLFDAGIAGDDDLLLETGIGQVTIDQLVTPDDILLVANGAANLSLLAGAQARVNLFAGVEGLLEDAGQPVSAVFSSTPDEGVTPAAWVALNLSSVFEPYGIYATVLSVDGEERVALHAPATRFAFLQTLTTYWAGGTAAVESDLSWRAFGFSSLQAQFGGMKSPEMIARWLSTEVEGLATVTSGYGAWGRFTAEVTGTYQLTLDGEVEGLSPGSLLRTRDFQAQVLSVSGTSVRLIGYQGLVGSGATYVDLSRRVGERIDFQWRDASITILGVASLPTSWIRLTRYASKGELDYRHRVYAAARCDHVRLYGSRRSSDSPGYYPAGNIGVRAGDLLHGLVPNSQNSNVCVAGEQEITRVEGERVYFGTPIVLTEEAYYWPIEDASHKRASSIADTLRTSEFSAAFAALVRDSERLREDSSLATRRRISSKIEDFYAQLSDVDALIAQAPPSDAAADILQGMRERGENRLLSLLDRWDLDSYASAEIGHATYAGFAQAALGEFSRGTIKLDPNTELLQFFMESGTADSGQVFIEDEIEE